MNTARSTVRQPPCPSLRRLRRGPRFPELLGSLGRRDGFPAFVVGARGHLGDVIARRISLDAGQFAEVVDRMAAIARTAANAEQKKSAITIAQSRKFADQSLELIRLEAQRRRGYHVQE